MAKEDNFTLKKINNYHYEVQKEGQHAYDIYKRGSKWACSCTGYKYRGKCKHVEALAEETKEPEKLHGVYARRAQIQKSYDIWKERYEKDPSKANEKQFKLREQQLADINKACEEEDKKPKPQRHPREEFLGVVESLEKLFEGLGKYEIVGSWRRGKCFAAGTRVRTINGWIPIEELKVGDVVFNGMGELTEVTRTFKEKQKEWCRVSYRRNSSLVCTPDHRFLVWKSSSPRRDFEWEEAQNLGKSSKWKMLTPLIKLPQDVSIGKERAFILGWYLSDGNLHLYDREEGKNHSFKLEYLDGGFYNVSLAANSTRSRQLLHLIAELGLRDFSFYANDKDNSQEIQIRDKWIIDFILEWGGFTSEKRGILKTPAPEILNLVAEEKKAFLEGFWLGDGTFGKYNSTESVRLFNTNKAIVEQLDLLLSEHYRTLRYEREQEGCKKCYEVRISGNDAATFIKNIPEVVIKSKYVDERERTCEGLKVVKQFEAVPQNVTSVELFEEEGYRYCIEVKDGESFIAENFAVHNSTYKDCDILTIMSPKEWKQLQERLEADPNFGPAPGRDRVDFGPEVIRGGYKNGDRVDYLDINRVPDPKEWGAWLIFRTGSQAFNIAMRGWLKSGGWKINERGLFNDKGELVARETEEEIFKAMGLPFIPPEQREDPSQFRKYFRGKPGPKEDKVEDSLVTNMTDFEDFIFDIECALEAFKTGRKQKFFMTYVVFRPQEDVSIELLIHMKPEDRKAESIKVTITEASNPEDKLIDEVIPYNEVAKRVANETRPFVNMRIDDAFKLAGKLMSMDISVFRNKRSFIGDSVQQKKESGLKYGNVAIKGIRDGKEFHAVITDKVIKSDFPFVMDQMLLQAFPGRIMDNFSKVDLSLWQKLIKA